MFLEEWDGDLGVGFGGERCWELFGFCGAAMIGVVLGARVGYMELIGVSSRMEMSGDRGCSVL